MFERSSVVNEAYHVICSGSRLNTFMRDKLALLQKNSWISLKLFSWLQESNNYILKKYSTYLSVQPYSFKLKFQNCVHSQVDYDVGT